jgi:hypothetical protein
LRENAIWRVGREEVEEAGKAKETKEAKEAKEVDEFLVARLLVVGWWECGG